MSILSKTVALPSEITAHDLLAESVAATETYQSHMRSIAEDAENRATVVKARLDELEAEKLILSRLSLKPTVFVGRVSRPEGQTNADWIAEQANDPQA